MQTLANHVEKFVGQKVAVIAAKYIYRGVLSEVGSDYMVLSHAIAVEVTGPATSERAQVEDPIQGSVAISMGAVELFFQPNFAMAPIPGYDD